MNFGGVCASGGHDVCDDNPEVEEEWVTTCRNLDQKAAFSIRQRIAFLLNKNAELKHNFEEMSGGARIWDQEIDTLVSTLHLAVKSVPNGRLLILVDEYDQPMREGLLPLIPHHGPDLYKRVKKQLRMIFPSFFGFFRAIKAALDEMSHAKIFLTGILPIAIEEMSGLPIKVVTFEPFMANAVGSTDEDVQNMLDRVHQYAPFKEGEQEVAKNRIKHHFNNLSFPGGKPLYHTALVNEMMNIMLQNGIGRKNFLLNDIIPNNLVRDKIASSVYDVLGWSRNLRPVVHKLVERRPVRGYKLNKSLSLEDLLQADIRVGDYLTLLLHVGVVSVTGNRSQAFTVTSELYRTNLLEPLLTTLRVSLEMLTSFTTTNGLYGQGESILVDFVTSISQNSMAKLMAWAASDPSTTYWNFSSSRVSSRRPITF